MLDTGPLVALFDPADSDHGRARRFLAGIEEPICTTAAVLTEAFHLLGPGTVGSQRLMDFIANHGLTVRFLNDPALNRAFELMGQYAV